MSNRRLEDITGTRLQRLPPNGQDDMDLRIVLDRVEAQGKAQVTALRELRGEFRDAITEQNDVIRQSVTEVLAFATNANKSIIRLVLLLFVLSVVGAAALVGGTGIHVSVPGFEVGTGAGTP